jgi:hypothetical protein
MKYKYIITIFLWVTAWIMFNTVLGITQADYVQNQICKINKENKGNK